jgi:hypothetical protein
MILVSTLLLAVLLFTLVVTRFNGPMRRSLQSGKPTRRDVWLLALIVAMISSVEVVVFFIEGGGANLVLALMGFAFTGWYVQMALRHGSWQ